MLRTYSIYEAKTKFTEIIRKVRQGQKVRISYRGTQVAEIRPLPPDERKDLAKILSDLEDAGVLTPPSDARTSLEPIAKRPGALARFLETRE